MAEPMKATQWGVRAVDAGFVRVNIKGWRFDFDPRGAADLAQTIRVILGVEERAERAVAEETDAVSDGYHTFGELYDHRRALTAALAKALSLDSWRSKAHHPGDSPMFEGGYFIVGINLPTGTITYHYKLSHWDDFAGVIELAHAPKWDGAPPAASVDRLLAWARIVKPVRLSAPETPGDAERIADEKPTGVHAFQQNPAATQVSVCICGLWRDHHLHGADPCGCDACRTTEDAEEATTDV